MAKISRNERREVVRRLREYAKTVTHSPEYLWAHLEIAVNGWHMGASGDESYVYDNEVLSRLADLIDKPTCRNVSGYKDVFECSECRCRVELITEDCNEYGETFHVPLMPSWCPNCGAMVAEDE